MSLTNDITIIEVGPRDGLQNEPLFVRSQDKIDWINLLSHTGLQYIEVTSFVSPKTIPQLADHHTVFSSIEKPEGVHFSALVPNEQGMLEAMRSGVKRVAIFTAASELFNQRNINCSIKESIQRFIPVAARAKAQSIHLRAYISCVLGCPYEGAIAPRQVNAVVTALLELGVDEISFGDTIGVGTPKQTKDLIQAVASLLPLDRVAMHFHDTYGQAIANVYVALESGVTRFDSAVSGIGGCPYARGASGNVATEDLLYLMHGLGLETNVDIYKVVAAGEMICKRLGRKNQSKVANALLANQV